MALISKVNSRKTRLVKEILAANKSKPTVTHGSKYNRGLLFSPVKSTAGFWLADVSSPKCDLGTQGPSTLGLFCPQCESSNVSMFNCVTFAERGMSQMMGVGEGAAYFPSPLQGHMQVP